MPPHRAEIWFSLLPCRPLPASGARNAAILLLTAFAALRQRRRAPNSADEVSAIAAETINAAPDVVAKAKVAMDAPDARPQSGAASP
jgi:hypothetical protein